MTEISKERRAEIKRMKNLLISIDEALSMGKPVDLEVYNDTYDRWLPVVSFATVGGLSFDQLYRLVSIFPAPPDVWISQYEDGTIGGYPRLTEEEAAVPCRYPRSGDRRQVRYVPAPDKGTPKGKDQ